MNSKLFLDFLFSFIEVSLSSSNKFQGLQSVGNLLPLMPVSD